MNYKKLLNLLIKFRKDRDWEKFHSPKNLAISLSIEANEILELFQWSKDNQLPKDKKKYLEGELADVYYYLLLIAHDMNIDLDKALRKKMKENEKRYPIERSKGSSKKYTEIK
ncbi:hypothetical protein ES702_01277 [subsurface metagenome]